MEFDSGSPLNFIPLKSMNTILKIFADQNIPCKAPENYGTGEANSSGVICQCSHENLNAFPEFDFEVGDHNFQLKPEAYMVHDDTLPSDQI